ncbi:MAG: zf-HC2 domain-containing protein [Planctomycetota bacterium]|nr:MAG: zf-HC2 domain-containing protein [Planctomycetota bacterium]
MTCQEMLRLLNEYIDGEIDPSLCAEFEHHLAGCDPCQVVIDTLRRTVTLYREGARYELPAAVHDRLHAELRRRWRARHGGSATSGTDAG